jgi:alpha-glucosidase
MVDFSFLGEGSFNARILKDGPNAGRIGVDYIFENVPVDKTSKLKLNMAVGGGFVIRMDSK